MNDTKGINKKALAEAVSAATGMSKKDAATAIGAVIDSLASALTVGEEVSLAGFGTFKVSKRKEMMRTNPRTKEKVLSPAKNVVVFKAAKGLKDAVANGKA